MIVCGAMYSCSIFGQAVINKIDGNTISFAIADQQIRALMDSARVMGLCIAVTNNDEPVYVRAFGLKNNRTKLSLDTSTVMYAASFSKSVFAYVVMQQVQKNVISLDTPLWKYLGRPIPDFANYKDLQGDDRWMKITARMCLSHSTGFPNWRFLTDKGYDSTGKLFINFTPGSRYAYSGEGLVLLQMVLEKVTGKGLQQLAQDGIFNPAGMVRTAYEWKPAFNENYAEGHDETGYVLFLKKRKSANAAGSMVTTIADFQRFIKFVRRNEGLSPAMTKEMLSPQVAINSRYQFPTMDDDTTTENSLIQLSYGLGWGLFVTPYGRAFFKEGHDDGWRNYTVNFTDRKISIIIMTNSANGESIFRKLLATVIGDTFTPWKWERYISYDELRK